MNRGSNIQNQQQQHASASSLQEAASALKSLQEGSSTNTSESGDGLSSEMNDDALQSAIKAGFASTPIAAADSIIINNKKAGAAADHSNVNADVGNNPNKQFDEEVPLTFPQRLMELLDAEESNDIIGWLPHGRGFLIYQKRRFASDVMPKYFKQSKFTSFTRKLNRWGFTRIARGPETGAYYHPLFRKGNLRLCLQMTCQTLKSSAPITGMNASAPTPAPARAPATNTAPKSDTVPNTTPVPDLKQQQIPLAASIPPPAASPAQQQPQLPTTSPMVATKNDSGPQSLTLDDMSVTESVLKLRQLQRQQEQLVIRQREVREQIQAISKALPGKIAQERRQVTVSISAPNAGTSGYPAATATPVATPTTQATPPTGVATSIATGNETQDTTYNKAVINAAVEALQRSNASSYLSLLMAQQGGKSAATVNTVQAGPSAPTASDFQNQLRSTVRNQLEQMRLFENQRRLQQQQQSIQQVQAQNVQSMQGVTLTDGGELKASIPGIHAAQAAATFRKQSSQKRQGAKRASAA